MNSRNQVGFVESALLLKTMPHLTDASPDQLAALLECAQERFYAPRTIIYRRGQTPTEIHIVIEGVVRLEGADGRIERRRRGQAIGALAALEQRPHAASCICETAVQTLALPVPDLFELLEDYFDLARALLAFLGDETLKLRRGAPTLITGSPVNASAPLGLLEKVIFLKTVPFLHGASVEELTRLAREASEVSFDIGETVHQIATPAAAFWVVLAGRVGTHGPRTSIGFLDVLAQRNYRETQVAIEPSRALRVPADCFFDLIEDHFDLLLRVSRDLGAMVRRFS